MLMDLRLDKRKIINEMNHYLDIINISNKPEMKDLHEFAIYEFNILVTYLKLDKFSDIVKSKEVGIYNNIHCFLYYDIEAYCEASLVIQYPIINTSDSSHYKMTYGYADNIDQVKLLFNSELTQSDRQYVICYSEHENPKQSEFDKAGEYYGDINIEDRFNVKKIEFSIYEIKS